MVKSARCGNPNRAAPGSIPGPGRYFFFPSRIYSLQENVTWINTVVRYHAMIQRLRDVA